MKATRPHIELFRAWMEDRRLAASTIDRRLSTVCGFYRLAHINGRIGSHPARRPPRRPRTTTIYDHRRQNFDRHAAYVVVAFIAGG